MPSYLIQTKYTAEGLKGVMQDKASGRKAEVTSTVTGLGGKVESLYYCFGDYDVILIANLPDNVTAAALAFALSAWGHARAKTTPLLTVEETDQALEKKVEYRGPGQYVACPGFRLPADAKAKSSA